MYTASKSYCKEPLNLTVFESTVNENEEYTLSKLLSLDGDVYAFSCYIWNIKRVLSLCSKIKAESPHSRIILGGPEVSYRQRSLLEENSFIDYILSGEGEITLPPLLASLSAGGDGAALKGVSCKFRGNIAVGSELIGDSFEYPSPYCEEYFASLGGRIAYIESSRGCPFSCAYCLSGRLGKVRYKDMNMLKKELILLSQSGTKTVKFVDRTFNCDNNRAVEILTFIKENIGNEIPEDVCFHFEISADILKESFIEAVSQLPQGTVQFEIGIQSFNEKTLKAIGRKCDTEKLKQNVKSLVALGNCHIHTDLIAGLPYEDFESFKIGFNESFYLGADMLQAGFLKLLYGSPMAESRGKHIGEFSFEPPYEVKSTPWLSGTELEKIHIAEKELDRLYNSRRFYYTIGYVLKVSSFTPFDFFLSVGEKLSSGSMHLDKLTNELFNVLSDFTGVDKTVLRDKMLLDRISTNNSGVIPKSLQFEDKRLKRIKHALSLSDKPKAGINRTVAILYGENKVVYCDYENKNPVKGTYELKWADIPENLLTD